MRYVHMLVLHNLRKCAVGGKWARARGEAQHGVRLGLNQISHGTPVYCARLSLVPDDDDFRHRMFLPSGHLDPELRTTSFRLLTESIIPTNILSTLLTNRSIPASKNTSPQNKQQNMAANA